MAAMAVASPEGAQAAFQAAIQSVVGAEGAGTFAEGFEKAAKAIGSQWESMGQRIAAGAEAIAEQAAPQVFRRLPGYAKAKAQGRYALVIFTTTGPGARTNDNYIKVSRELMAAVSAMGTRLFGLGIRTAKNKYDQIFRIDYWEHGQFDLHYHIYGGKGQPIP